VNASPSVTSVKRKRTAIMAQEGVDKIYPVIATGKPHHITRKKQRIAWQLGYLRGYEEAKRMHFHEPGKNDDR
jgi:hypothetical protein